MRAFGVPALVRTTGQMQGSDKLPYRAMYIWTDGTEPTHLLRSKTKVLPDGTEPPVWGFDGSSTNQAPGGSSDVVLNPVKIQAGVPFRSRNA